MLWWTLLKYIYKCSVCLVTRLLFCEIGLTLCPVHDKLCAGRRSGLKVDRKLKKKVFFVAYIYTYIRKIVG